MDSHHCCFVVPPYLLSAIAENYGNEHAGQAAANTLMGTQIIHQRRQTHFEEKITARARSHGHSGAENGATGGQTQQNIVPPYLLEQIANAPDVDDATKEAARNTMASSAKIRDDRAAAVAPASAPSASSPVFRAVYDMHSRGGDDDPNGDRLLPGTKARLEGQPEALDHAANEAYDNCGKVLKFYKDIFDYNSGGLSN